MYIVLKGASPSGVGDQSQCRFSFLEITRMKYSIRLHLAGRRACETVGILFIRKVEGGRDSQLMLQGMTVFVRYGDNGGEVPRRVGLLGDFLAEPG